MKTHFDSLFAESENAAGGRDGAYAFLPFADFRTYYCAAREMATKKSGEKFGPTFGNS
jgi:hypothetical protein